MNNKIKIVAAIAAITIGSAANATIATVFDGISAGEAAFDATVTGAGGTVNFDTWSGMSSGANIDRGDYTITQNDGGIGAVQTYGTMSGQVIVINPSGGGSNPRTNPTDYFNSGISFNFLNPVNSVGFEVGDWATCCFDPNTELFISFDGGAPIMVASANNSTDGLFPSQTTGNNTFEIFIAAFDDTDSFSTVSFWGNGVGEFLVAGGQLRYSLIDQGSLPGGVPEPASLALLGLGLAGISFSRRKKRA